MITENTNLRQLEDELDWKENQERQTENTLTSIFPACLLIFISAVITALLFCVL